MWGFRLIHSAKTVVTLDYRSASEVHLKRIVPLMVLSGVVSFGNVGNVAGSSRWRW